MVQLMWLLKRQQVPFNPWPSFIFELILAIILAIAGYFVISYLVKKILKENELINGKESDDKVEVAVISPEVVGVEDVADGATTATNTDENNALSINDSQFEISNKEFEINENDYKVESIENVENTEGETNNENQTLVEGEKKEESVSISEEKKPMGMGTMVMFMLSGIYLVFNWLLVLINGFMI